jgi:cytochrome c553
MPKLTVSTVLIILFLGILACATENGQDGKNTSAERTDAEAKFNMYCGACHWQKMPEKPIAPPIYNIKRRYTMSYRNEADFVKAITEWVAKPAEKEAVMPGAVENFKTMPKLGYSEKDVEEIAAYIYNTDFPPAVIPDIMRYKMGGRGMGKGHGRGMGMGYGRKGGGRGAGRSVNRGACAPGFRMPNRPQNAAVDSIK